MDPYVSKTAAEVREWVGTHCRKFYYGCLQRHKPQPIIVGGRRCETVDDVDSAIDEAVADAEDGDDAMLRAIWLDYDCTELDADGNLLTTHNPDGKWGRYQIGGHWDGRIDGNACRVSDLPDDIDSFVLAIVTPDGEWHANGAMDRLGYVSGKDCRWKLNNILKGYQGYDAVLVDCHV